VSAILYWRPTDDHRPLYVGLGSWLHRPYGRAETITYRADDKPLPAWAARAKRAHLNAVENLAPFAALIITAHLAGAASPTTAMASIVYFWARVAHYPAYISGLPVLRTLTYAVAWVAMLVVFYEIVT
jgi:uncharacterized MAPEG superfamily protein